jgi:hypothetical protein
MQKYTTIKKLSSAQFRRLTGAGKHTFEKMVSVAKEGIKNKKSSRRGKPLYLTIEDNLLMTLEYLREYRTYFHLGQSYGLSESACYRNCKRMENILIKSREFSLPGKKSLLKNNVDKKRYVKGRELLIGIVSMLVKMAQKH